MATFTKRVAASGDDGYSYSGFFDNADDFVHIGYFGGVARVDSFYRFTAISIPKNSEIISAKLTFKSYANSAGNTVLTNIYCNDEDNATAPTNEATHNAKVRTTAFTAWDSVPAWTENTEYDSADFTSAVQEVINRVGWASGNALMVLIDDDGSSNAANRSGDSQDLGETTAALLTIQVVDFIPRTGGIF